MPRDPDWRGSARAKNRKAAKIAERRLLAAMRENPGLTIDALAPAASLSRTAVRFLMLHLAAKGLVDKSSAGRWRVKEERQDAR
jgi:DNA-binding GntR family transcriptional regulator